MVATATATVAAATAHFVIQSCAILFNHAYEDAYNHYIKLQQLHFVPRDQIEISTHEIKVNGVKQPSFVNAIQYQVNSGRGAVSSSHCGGSSYAGHNSYKIQAINERLNYLYHQTPSNLPPEHQNALREAGILVQYSAKEALKEVLRKIIGTSPTEQGVVS